MGLTSNQLFLLNNVFTKVKYDKLTRKYTINLSDYIHLKLNQTRMKLLEKMCAENNIELEKLPPQLTMKQTNTLLMEYNRLKLNPTENEDEANNIRNKIVIGNLDFLYQLIAIHIKSIDSEEDRRDLYQDAHEILITAVDTYDVKKRKSFVEHIYRLTYDYIIKKIEYMKNPEYLKMMVSKINSSFEEYVKKNGKTPPLVILSSMTRYSPKVIQELQKLENNVEIDSIERINEEEEALGKTIIDYNQYGSEEYLMNLFLSNEVKKVLKTLPKIQQAVITLCFGLDGNGMRNNSEIANELGISRMHIGSIKEEAIANLNLPPRRNHLKRIYLDNSRVSYIDRGILKAKYSQKTIKKSREYIEDFLIRNMNKRELSELINQMPPKFGNVLSLIYGAEDGIERTIIESAQILGVSPSTLYSRKNQGIVMLRSLLEAKYKHSCLGTIDKDYLDCMMDEYMSDKKDKNIKKR